MTAFRNFIGGEWVASATGVTFETRNPANTDEVVGVYQKSDAADTRQAIEAAQKAQPAWAAVQAPKREQQKIRFAVQQMVHAMSPANFLATNPDAQQTLIDTKGESLAKGLTNMLADMQKGRISLSDESAFEVGAVSTGETRKS